MPTQQRIVVSSGQTSSLITGKIYKTESIMSNGGVVEVLSGGTLNTNGAVFTSNQVTSDQGSRQGRGGAIYNDGTANVSGGSFNSNKGQNGGAIFNSGAMTISGATFSGNSAGNLGGAIYNSCGTLDVIGATFSGNNVSNNGAGIYVSSGTLNVSGASFIGNNASKYGGAIVLNKGTVNVSGGSFVSNSAKNAAAIYSYSGTVEVIGATFSGNNVSSGGGAIITRDVLNVSGGSFVGNSAGTFGGAIVNSIGTVNVFDATFSGNSAGTFGGAIYNTGKVTESGTEIGTVNVSGGSFTGNCASLGGAICNDSGCTTTISGVTFSGNNASYMGGAIYNSGGTMEIFNATFAGNSASFGGVIDNYKGTVDLSDVTFSGNVATSSGGAIFNEEGATMNLKGAVTLATESDDINNDSGAVINWDLTNAAPGGAVVLNGYQNLNNKGDLTITVNAEQTKGDYTIATGSFDSIADKNTFTLKTAEDVNGVTLTVNGDEVTYSNRSYKLAEQDGSLVLSTESVKYSLTSVSNLGEQGGVTFYVYNSYPPIKSDKAAAGDNIIFSEIRVDGYYVVDCTSDDITIVGSSFTMPDKAVTLTVTYAEYNERYIVPEDDVFTVTLSEARYTAKSYDGNGGLAEVSSGGTLIVASDVEISSNYASSGGAVYNTSSGTVNVSGGTFYYNTANAGGAIYNTENGTLSVSGGSFTGNYASDYGGAIYNTYDATANLTDAVFSGNQADYAGGAIYNTRGATANVVGGTFVDNSASNGGAIYNNYSTTLNVSGAVFSGNQASSAGGAIYINSSSNLNVSGGSFSGNSAGENGGAIYINYSCTLNVSGGGFIGNSAGKYGGAIYMSSNILDVADAVFSGNQTTSDGGAIYNDGGTLNISGGSFIGNSAESYGGAINNYEAEATISGGSFVGNSAGGKGGAIYNNGSVIVSGATFSGNSATSGGGAIYNDGGTVNLKDNVTLATATDTVYNAGTLNWDLTGDTTGSLAGYQYLDNDADGTLAITVNAKQAKGDYTIATGNFDSIDGKNSFTLKTAEDDTGVSITVGGDEVTYNNRIYSLAVQDSSSLVLNVKSNLGVEVDTELVDKWFKQGDSITITGTYLGENFTSFKFGDNDVTDYNPAAKTWSYTFDSHDDTTGTNYDIVISSADDSESTTYTLKVDTLAPTVENAAFEAETKYVDGNGKTWFRQNDTAKLSAEITDETSGLDTVTYNGVDYDAAENKFDISTASEVDVDAQTIQASDAAGNANNTVAIGAYGVDGMGPTVDTIETDNYQATSKYVDGKNNVWVRKGDALSVNVMITDSKSGLKSALAVPESGASVAYENNAFSGLDTSTESTPTMWYVITTSDNVGNQNNSSSLSYGVDGTGPTITLKNAVTAGVCNDFALSGAPESAIATKATDTVDAGTDMSKGYTSKWFNVLDESYTITIEDQILTRVTVNGIEQALTGTSFDYTFNPDQGENVYEIVATDGVGNETKSTITLKYDSEDPVFAANSITAEGIDYAGSDLTTAKDTPVAVSDITSFNITLNATDASTLTNSYSFSADGTTGWTDWTVFSADNPITTGEGYYRFATVDQAGNTAIAEKYFYIGRPVEYTLSDSVAVTYDGQAHGITVTVTDPEGGVGASVYYSTDGGENWTLTENNSYMLTDATKGATSVCFKIVAKGYTTTYTEERTISIGQKWLDVVGSTAESKVYDGTRDAVVTPGTLEGVVEGDDVTLVAKGTFGTPDVGDNKTVTTRYTLEGDDAGNYKTTAFASLRADILKAPVSNYNHSTKSDMIQFVNGLVYVTHDTEEGYVQTAAVNDVTGWNVVETRRDLTGDGLADVQITSDDGCGSTWVATLRNDYLKDGAITLNYQFIGAYDNKLWSYLGSADVNGDGKAEVLMVQTEAGADEQGHRNVAAWVTDETGTWVGNDWVGALNSGWDVAGTADLDGDGTDNVILRRADGLIGYWGEAGADWVSVVAGNEQDNAIAGSMDDALGDLDEMNSSEICYLAGDDQDGVTECNLAGMTDTLSAASTSGITKIANAGSSVLLTTGDFTGDGADDFLFTNAAGDFFTWSNVTNSLKVEKLGNLDDLGGNWAFAGAGDYNGDGKEDLLWCDTEACKIAYGGTTAKTFSNLTVIV